MNVGDPNDVLTIQRRESDMLVVVKITGKVKPEGAEGHYFRYVSEWRA